jgi:hypothetical protein
MSDKLNEIFKDRPDLLEMKEVKELIHYVKEQYVRQMRLNQTFRTKISTITDLVFDSEMAFINGKSSKETILKIIETL